MFDFLKEKGVIIPENGHVIDIGSGDGREGLLFKENGLHVTDIDIKYGIDATTYDYPQDTYDIAIAKNSLPFMNDKQFDVIKKVYHTLKNGGYFYGTVFGKDEPWVEQGILTGMDFIKTEDYLKELGFKVVWKSEEKGIGKSMKDELKNWHIFKFLCQKLF